MLYTQIQPQSLLDSGEELLSVFTIHGHGGQLVQWCGTI